jgi:hypothetical protein
MGIVNIHLMVEDTASPSFAQRAQAALEQQRINEHRRGLHPWGSMRRDCPLCVNHK